MEHGRQNRKKVQSDMYTRQLMVFLLLPAKNTEQWYTYDQTGTKLDEWDRIKFDGSYGYAQDSSSGHRGICEVYNGYTYASLNSHVAKISSDGSYEYLS